MFTFESPDEQFNANLTQAPAMFSSPATPVELKIPVPFRPLTIPSVPDFIYEDGCSPTSTASGSSSQNTPPKTPSSKKSKPYTPRLSRNRSPDHVPRPPNPFILFACHVRGLPDSKGVNNRELSKRAGDLWNELSDGERAYWKAEAQKAKESHAERYPGYRYRPRRREPPSLEKDSEDSKKSARAPARRRPPPLSLQPESHQVLYPLECITSPASEYDVLQVPSYSPTSVRFIFSLSFIAQYLSFNTGSRCICKTTSPSLFRMGIIPSAPSITRRVNNRTSMPLSPSDLNDFHLLSLQTPPINVHYHGVDFSVAYPSPVSPAQLPLHQHFSAHSNRAQQQVSSYYRYQ